MTSQLPAKLTIPFLTPARLADLGRAESTHCVKDVILNISTQACLPEQTWEQMTELTIQDPILTLAEFTRVWKTLILNRVQTTYSQIKRRPPPNLIRIDDIVQVPAPLADLLDAIGNYHHKTEGVSYHSVPPEKPKKDASTWWKVDDLLNRKWNRMMAKNATLYTMKPTPSHTLHDDRPMMLTSFQEANGIRSVRSKFACLDPIDGLIVFVNDKLYSEFVYAYDNCKSKDC